MATQKKLSSTIDDMHHKTLFQLTPLPVDRARLTAVSAPHASAWLSVIPNEQLGLTLSPHEWRAVARWWMGAEVFSEDSKCPFFHHDQGRSGHHATVWQSNQTSQHYSQYNFSHGFSGSPFTTSGETIHSAWYQAETG